MSEFCSKAIADRQFDPGYDDPAMDCCGCDRVGCEAMEMAPKQFFTCPCCKETLCDVHAEPIFDSGLQRAICRECYETGGPRAGR